MNEVEKPPRGLQPKWIHDAQRATDILNTIKRYIEADMSFPKIWVEELDDLLEDYMERHKDIRLN